MKLQDKLDRIRDIALDYSCVDWWHHKQYALYEILRIIEDEDYLNRHFPWLDKWIPD